MSVRHATAPVGSQQVDELIYCESSHLDLPSQQPNPDGFACVNGDGQPLFLVLVFQDVMTALAYAVKCIARLAECRDSLTPRHPGNPARHQLVSISVLRHLECQQK